MTSQRQLPKEIKDRSDKIESQIKELRANWGVMDISGIQDVVEDVDQALTFVKSELPNHPDKDAYNKVERLIDRLEDYYAEAQSFLHEAKACEEKAVLEGEEQDSDDDRLSVILEVIDEDST